MRGQSEAKEQAVRAEYNEIKVVPLDMDKLNADIDEAVKAWYAEKGEDIPAARTYSIQGYPIAFVEGTTIETDAEAVHYISADGKTELGIGFQEKTDTGTSYSFGAVLTNEYNIQELVEKYGQDPQPLPDFMGSRFNYNPRIEQNMRILRKSIRSTTSKGSR